MHAAPTRPAPQPDDAAAPSPRAPRPPWWELAFHPMKTLHLVGALLRDPRVSIIRKLAFIVPVTLAVAALIAPETVLGVVVAAVLPLVGPLVNLPVDLSFDWLAVGLLAYALLRVFPAPVVREHHLRIFHRTPASPGR
jgi:hypothetical protein